MPKETLGSDGNQTVVKWRKDGEHAEFPNTPGHVSVAVLNPSIEDPDQTGAAGFYVDLDADQIDYLIAVLRKARRQAFPEHHSAHAAPANGSSSEPLDHNGPGGRARYL